MQQTEIILISKAQALSVIDTRTPAGRFIQLENDLTYTAIDNQTGDAWTENFTDKETATRWLNGEFEIVDGKFEDYTE